LSLIKISNLSFSYDGSCENVFENVSIQLDTSWRLGFVGRNGRGKTTLLKLLTGELHGSGNISASVDFEYFPYAVRNENNFTIDIIREIAPDIEDWEIYREMSLLNISEGADYQPFSTLSSGEQTKALLVGLFLRQNAFLLIDEPTNHLDSDGRELLGKYLSRKSGFILVSHDRNFIDACTDHILSINRRNIEITRGNYSEWQRNKDMRDSFEISQNERLKKDIKRLETAARRTAEWSDKAERAKIGFDPAKVEKSINRRPMQAAKAKKMMSRSAAIAERRERAIDEKSKLLHNIESTAELKMRPLDFHTKQLICLENIAIRYGNKTACESVTFNVTQGSRTALVGANGCGKSSVLKLICGDFHGEYSGNLIKNNGLKISYVPQNTDHLRGSLKEYADSLSIDFSLFLAILRKLDFSREHFEQNIENFSAGQKKKVLIAGSLCEQAHLYIWDEPLNYIDIISRVQIEELILKSCATIIFVEHDSAFREKIADNIVVIGEK